MPTGRPPSLAELNATIGPPQALPDRVYALIKHQIITCAILPGQRLNEKDLAADLKVREMLRKKLAQAGISKILIERPAKTARVTITTPGRAVWIVIRARLAGRSMTIRLRPACARRFSRKERILRSSARSFA